MHLYNNRTKNPKVRLCLQKCRYTQLIINTILRVNSNRVVGYYMLFLSSGLVNAYINDRSTYT